MFLLIFQVRIKIRRKGTLNGSTGSTSNTMNSITNVYQKSLSNTRPSKHCRHTPLGGVLCCQCTYTVE